MKYWKIITSLCMVLCMGIIPANTYAASAQPELYGIGSVSKMYTAASVMKLVEEGKLELDASLMVYLPEFTMADDRYRLITPIMLLNHTSGLQGSVYTNSMTLGAADSENHDMLLERLKHQRLKADPGSFAVYCNDGFTLAELLVERVSGMSFTEYIKKVFGDPLGIEALETSQSQFDRSCLADIYMNREKKIPYESANLIGSGGIYSTAEDICRFFQIFTKNSYTGAQPILSETSVKEMGEANYISKIWKPVSENGSAVAFGLGWDTVEEYPFKEYGIKAWSKGGDTIAYHAGVTVLPEENVSCAVVTSGGNSMAASLAVQAILTEYLEERGKLTTSSGIEQQQTKAAEIPYTFNTYGGWYASGSQMMKVSFADEMLTIESFGTEHDSRQTYLYQSDGSFVSQGQGYLSMEGSLVAAEGGVYGTTVLRFEEDSQKQSFITMETTQYQPGMGTLKSSVPFAQKLEEVVLENTKLAPWKGLENEDYLLISESYVSAMYLENPSIKLYLNPDMEGYVGMRGLSDSISKIIDDSHAVFFQQIPGHAGRDLNDLSVIRKQGVIYVDHQNYRFCNAASIPLWSKETKQLVIDETETGQWYDAGAAAGTKVCITAPENGNFYVYRTTKDGLTYTAGSISGDSGRPVYLPTACKILFTGEAGAEFKLESY